jgi:hypothetical protein
VGIVARVRDRESGERRSQQGSKEGVTLVSAVTCSSHAYLAAGCVVVLVAAVSWVSSSSVHSTRSIHSRSMSGGPSPCSPRFGVFCRWRPCSMPSATYYRNCGCPHHPVDPAGDGEGVSVAPGWRGGGWGGPHAAPSPLATKAHIDRLVIGVKSHQLLALPLLIEILHTPRLHERTVLQPQRRQNLLVRRRLFPPHEPATNHTRVSCMTR